MKVINKLWKAINVEQIKFDTVDEFVEYMYFRYIKEYVPKEERMAIMKRSSIDMNDEELSFEFWLYTQKYGKKESIYIENIATNAKVRRYAKKFMNHTNQRISQNALCKIIAELIVDMLHRISIEITKNAYDKEHIDQLLTLIIQHDDLKEIIEKYMMTMINFQCEYNKNNHNLITLVSLVIKDAYVSYNANEDKDLSKYQQQISDYLLMNEDQIKEAYNVFLEKLREINKLNRLNV